MHGVVTGVEACTIYDMSAGVRKRIADSQYSEILDGVMAFLIAKPMARPAQTRCWERVVMAQKKQRVTLLQTYPEWDLRGETQLLLFCILVTSSQV